MLEPGDAIDAEVVEAPGPGEAPGTAVVPVSMSTDPVDPLDVPTSSRHPTPDRRCSGTSKRTGLACMRHSVAGATVCYYHGANAAVRARAAQTLATREVTAIVARRSAEVTPRLDDPVEALLECAAQTRAISDLLADRLANSSAEDSIGIVGAYRSALKDTGAMLAAVVKLDLLSRRLEPPDHATARAVGRAVDRAITDDEVGLSFEQIEVFRRVFRRHMAEAFDQ